MPENVEKSKVYMFYYCETEGDFVKIVTGRDDGMLTFANIEVFSGYECKMPTYIKCDEEM